ncbi:MAG: hypothetical protein IJ400_04735 [Clostridia bacterium]|nr:hypothetical protein [Clostridia bacterium]
MSNTQATVQHFVIIAEQKLKNKFLSLLSDYGAKGIQTVYGRGSMNPNALASAFGFEVEQKKVLITCLVKSEQAKELVNILYNDYKFSEPNTGIAFSIPVEGLAF